MLEFILASRENDYEEQEKTKHEELKILIRKLIPIMKGGCYSATVAINKFQVQAVECSVIFFIIVDSNYILKEFVSVNCSFRSLYVTNHLKTSLS